KTHIICPDFELPKEIEHQIQEKLKKLEKLPHELLDVEVDIRQTTGNTAHSDTLMKVGINLRKDSNTYYSEEKAGNVMTATNQAVNEVFRTMTRDREKDQDISRKKQRDIKNKITGN
ncbi:MAG: HPF/RaiA family ribosome-associated protein, partial [Candidatus Paceibacteria bacterium]